MSSSTVASNSRIGWPQTPQDLCALSGMSLTFSIPFCCVLIWCLVFPFNTPLPRLCGATQHKAYIVIIWESRLRLLWDGIERRELLSNNLFVSFLLSFVLSTFWPEIKPSVKHHPTSIRARLTFTTKNTAVFLRIRPRGKQSWGRVGGCCAPSNQGMSGFLSAVKDF